ncbi:hypothetical protein FR943_01555 [Mycobacterium sp. TNTM28]|uniref:EF-hand domain-containing protein n=1 Tax=[Mycobacterium] fortunisiensis TaxID=2600579 RepID=A0ABS6KG54_9MYCO|nr:hypothetical protein [[Mycobacterium] fortunisiensis]MBU9762538.1 hypothetical protein [[Mycobacterium] fortunisiensis]
MECGSATSPTTASDGRGILSRPEILGDPMTQAPTLADFGHGAMLQRGRAATGTRPLLIVLAEYSDFPPFSDYHPPNYYPDLAFGTPAPPFGGANPASLREYFSENSDRRFRFEDIGVVGPLAMGEWVPGLGDKPEIRWRTILDLVPQETFAGLDVNNDDEITAEELCVVIFENYHVPGNPAQPANRDNYAVLKMIGNPPQPTELTVHVAGAGPLTPFYQIAHELSHSLGTIDLYGYGGNYLLTLMSGYSFDADDQVPVHLDSWHKLHLGWIEPKIRDMAAAGSEVVGTQSNGSIILWDTARRENEYFLFERRGPNLPGRTYDSGVAGDGVLVWRVSTDVAHLGDPSLTYGGSSVWTAGDQTPLLRWADGTSSGTSVRVATGADGALRIEWMPWGAEVTQTEPEATVIDEGGRITRTRRDKCGNVLRFGSWKTTTTVTFTVATVGFVGPQITWAVEDKPIAAGATSLAVDLGPRTFTLGCAMSPDGRSLTLTSPPGDVFQMGVSVLVSDGAGHSAQVKAAFSVDSGSYTGMHPDDIRRAAQCIADTIPVQVEPGDFIIPLEWPGWRIEQWKRNALTRLQAHPDLGGADRDTLTSLIELQVESPQFKVAAADKLLGR